MRRRNSAIGLVVCLGVLSTSQNENVSYPLWSDLSLVGALVFLVLLCIGPRNRRKSHEEEEQR